MRPFNDIVGWGLPHHHPCPEPVERVLGGLKPTLRLGILIICMLPPCLLAKTETGAGAAEPMKYAIKAGKILTVTQGTINHGVVLVEDRVIKAVGTAADVAIPNDYTVIDASDKWIMPGMVEVHSHIGAELGGLNDMVVPINPELRVMDNVDPESWELKCAVKSGVTTLHTIPGSGTNLAGFGVLYKAYGKTIEQMLIRELGS